MLRKTTSAPEVEGSGVGASMRPQRNAAENI